MLRIIICDLDGTLCNCDHRLHLAKHNDWDRFNAACIDDKINSDIANILSNLHSEETQIYLVTGRDSKFKEQTLEWLRLHDIWYDRLIMRSAGDYRADSIVKKEILDEQIDKEKVWFVLDDRKSVVDMWRENGLRCLQVQEGDF
jgi:hydroxymethylpyrimidine pyrophosphatase-like HAD family hydrolase